MKSISREFPPKWAEDHLTKHIDLALSNVAATFSQEKTWCPILFKVDVCYQEIVNALVNIQDLLEGMFLMRSHAAFRAGSLLAMSGHNTETFPILRNCLENAFYALHIFKNKKLAEVWLERHKDEICLKTVKTQFTHSSVIRTLEVTDPENYKVAKMLYERTIDFGGHPNERSVTGSLNVKTEGEKKFYMQDYLSGGTEVNFHALKSTAQVGLCSLLVFEIIFKERFAILGITEKLKYLKTKL